MTIITNQQLRDLKILVCSLAAEILPDEVVRLLRVELMSQPEIAATTLAIAQTFNKPELTRSLNLAKGTKTKALSLELDFQETQVRYQGQVVGQTKILFKSSASHFCDEHKYLNQFSETELHSEHVTYRVRD
jgi:hypothetical protein